MMGALKRIEKIISENPFEEKKKKPWLKFNRGLAPVGHEGSLFKRFFKRWEKYCVAISCVLFRNAQFDFRSFLSFLSLFCGPLPGRMSP